MERWSKRGLVAGLSALALMGAPTLAGAVDGKGHRSKGIEIHINSGGAELHGDASPKEIGLAVYPGAERVHDDDDTGALNLGFWSGDDGLRLQLIEYRSPDAEAKVLAFYKTELARIGPVTVCVGGTADAGPGCGDLHGDAGSTELRAGPDSDRRIVAVSPKDGATKFVLLRLRQHGLDKK